MSNLILVGLVCLILAVSILWNLLRGLSKSRLRGILILVSAVLAVVTTLVLRSTLVSNATIEIIFENLSSMPEVLELLQLSEEDRKRIFFASNVENISTEGAENGG